MSLRRILSQYWFGLQERLFPALEEAIGPLGERYQSFVAVLELVRVERLLPHFTGLPGRPRKIVPRWRARSSPRRCSTSPPPAR